jgi:hypothetical protein
MLGEDALMVAGQERPSFELGNDAALVHGAYSPALLAERAKQVHDALLEVAPWVAERHYAPSVDRYLKATAREQLAHNALVGMDAGARGFTRLLETATAASRLAWAMADALGLTPAGHARLRVLVAGGERAEASLVALGEQGRRARAAADVSAIDATVEDDGGGES